MEDEHDITIFQALNRVKWESQRRKTAAYSRLIKEFKNHSGIAIKLSQGDHLRVEEEDGVNRYYLNEEGAQIVADYASSEEERLRDHPIYGKSHIRYKKENRDSGSLGPPTDPFSAIRFLASQYNINIPFQYHDVNELDISINLPSFILYVAQNVYHERSRRRR